LYGYGQEDLIGFNRDRNKSIETIGEISPNQSGDHHVPDVDNSKSTNDLFFLSGSIFWHFQG